MSSSESTRYKGYIAMMIRSFGGITERDLMLRFKMIKYRARKFIANYVQEHPNTIAYSKHIHRYEKAHEK